MSSNVRDLPLPYGWVKQIHESGHPYYVDTRANPPRSIWTHPYEDEQYLSEHPEVREKVRPVSSMGSAPPPSNDNLRERRHSYNGQSSSNPNSPVGTSHPQKRGFFGKIKDKAIGTKEEREAEKRRMAQLQEQRRQQRLAQQQAYAAQYGQQPYGNQRYGAPQYGYGGPQYGYAPQGGTGGFGSRRSGFGGAGMALPLLGGLAGGLLLGEALDDFGGGGFDGGGFDGGFDNGFGGF